MIDIKPSSLAFLPALGAFAILSACNGQPIAKRTVVITHDTIPIPGQWPMPTEEGQLCHWVRNMHQDRSGALWFGTNHFGVIRYANDTLEYLADSAGITSGRINAIAESVDGTIWLATDGEGLFFRRPQVSRAAPHLGFSRLTTKDGLLDDHIWSMRLGRDGSLWLGTMTGLCTYDGERFETIQLPPSTAVESSSMLSPTRITCILEDRDGHIWFGRDEDGLFKYDRHTGAFEHFTVSEGLCDNSVCGLLQDRRGDLWIATMLGGLSRYDGRGFTNYTKGGVITGVEIAGLYQDKAGHIWFAAEHEGVYRYDGRTFTRFGEPDGLGSQGILAIMEDREGRFWFGGFGGLWRFDGKRFLEVRKTGPWDAG